MIKHGMVMFVTTKRKSVQEPKEVDVSKLDSYALGTLATGFLESKQMNMALVQFFNEQLENDLVDKMEIYVDDSSYSYATMLNVMLYSEDKKIEEYSVYIESEHKRFKGLDFMLYLLKHEDKQVILYDCTGSRVYEHITELDIHYDYEELIEKYWF